MLAITRASATVLSSAASFVYRLMAWPAVRLNRPISSFVPVPAEQLPLLLDATRTAIGGRSGSDWIDGASSRNSSEIGSVVAIFFTGSTTSDMAIVDSGFVPASATPAAPDVAVPSMT